jgi:hypothetical protein
MSVLNAIIKFSEAPKVAIGARFHLISIRNDFKTPSPRSIKRDFASN